MDRLEQIGTDINNGLIDAAFDEELEIQSLVIGDGLNFAGYIIDLEGNTKDYDFSFETMKPPSAKELIESYKTSKKENISIHHALYNSRKP